jgi:hypothetical protein
MNRSDMGKQISNPGMKETKNAPGLKLKEKSPEGLF